MERSKDAEKDIIKAARKVFIEKGYRDATMRDIAAEANINLAMVNYYFRSKENLFYIIYDETFTIFFSKIINCIKKEDADIKSKIKTIIDEYVDFFIKNSYLPAFILGEIIRNPQKIAARMEKNLHQTNLLQEFELQIEHEVKAGLIKPVSALSIFTNLLSLIIFPIIGRPIIQEVFSLKTSEYKTYLENRKKEITELILSSIEP